jgi:hypothetical protein
MSTTETYQPMRNDRRDFDPMGDDWSYILDTGNRGEGWRELVAVNARRATWPFELHADRSGHSYGSVRLSPDWAFYSWGGEYVGAYWDADRPHEVRCHVYVGRDYRNGTSWAPAEKWDGEMTLDLLAGTHSWRPFPRDADKAVPDDVAAEFAHKGAKLLAFFADACEHWRAGDRARPLQAHELYDPDYRPAPRDETEAAQQAASAREAHEAGQRHDLELCGLPHDIEGGLMVTRCRGHAGWAVVHAASGKAAHSGQLRLKRHAVQARAELLATGVDFTRDAKAIAHARGQWKDVYFRWSSRALSHGTDMETGERYGAK